MSKNGHHENVLPGKFEVPSSAKTLYSVCMFLGVLTMGLGFWKYTDRTWHAFLVAFFYFLCLGLGGLFFAAIQHITNAGWSVNVRRLAESFTAFLPFAAIGALVLVLGSGHLYEWLDTAKVAEDALLTAKSAYLNKPFFVVRLVVYFALWVWFAKILVGNSLKQDKTGDDELTHKNVKASIPFLITFALSFSLFSVDVIMSLEPHWFSTIFGIYCFSGLFHSTIAAMIVLAIYLQNLGLLKGLVNENHMHDLGKFLKAFCVFYAYIAFSQFMLIWYANLPEETIYYLNRANGGWMVMSVGLLLFKFAVPFLVLLPRDSKRNPSILGAVAVLILVMQYIDIHWMVYPVLNNQEVLLSWQEIGVFLGFLGLFLFSVMRFLSTNAIVPVKDPRRHESIAHHVTY